MPKAKSKPGVIELADGERYQATVLRILDRDDFGRPHSIQMVHDDETVHVEGGEEFMIVCAPSHMLRKQS